MSHELAYPVYCRKCREQIQSDALFCPKCGWDQRNTKVQEPLQVTIVQDPPAPGPLPPPHIGYAAVSQSPPQAQAPAPPQVVYVQQNNGGSGAGEAIAAIGLFALLVPPMGCVTIPALLFAVWAVAVAGILALPSIAFSIVGVIGKAIALKVLPASQRKYGDWILVVFILIGLIVNALVLGSSSKR